MKRFMAIFDHSNGNARAILHHGRDTSWRTLLALTMANQSFLVGSTLSKNMELQISGGTREEKVLETAVAEAGGTFASDMVVENKSCAGRVTIIKSDCTTSRSQILFDSSVRIICVVD
jgi:hypothetical protein